MSNHQVSYDACLLDDANRVIYTAYVDLRALADRSPITTVIKRCKRQHAIEYCKKVRISKPKRFWTHGDGLIQDPSEARASNTQIVRETVDDPRHLVEGRLLREVVARTSEHVQVPLEINALSTQISTKTTDSVTYGKNGWIFSASIEPTNQEEHGKWGLSLPENRDHDSYILRPREFARALGLMVVEQLGPQGQETEWGLSFPGADEIVTRHMSQLIFHGPVMYVEDLYTWITNAPSELEAALRSVFGKEMKYRDQREYRFAIWAEEEPTDEVKDLDASLALLGAMQEAAQTGN